MGARVTQVDVVPLVSHLLVLLFLVLSKHFIWLKINEFESVSEEIWFDELVCPSVHGHSWAGVYFEQPGLLLVVDHYVETHYLEAVFLVGAHRAQIYASQNYYFLDLGPNRIEVEATARKVIL